MDPQRLVRDRLDVRAVQSEERVPRGRLGLEAEPHQVRVAQLCGHPRDDRQPWTREARRRWVRRRLSKPSFEVRVAPDIAAARDYARRRLSEELPPTLRYHALP